MPLAEDMSNVVGNMLSSYEMRIESIGAIFDTTHHLLQSFQESFLDTRLEREKINDQLREILARNESLRKKDFDRMMQDILSIQDRREEEVRELLNSYLNGQKEMAHSLRSNLAKVKDSVAKGETQRAKEFQTVINDILSKQEERKQEAIFRLKEFQKGQHEMAKGLKELLAKGMELRVRDLKSMLAEFKIQHKERTYRQKERNKEVQNTINSFRAERLENAEDWQDMQKRVAQRRTDAQPVISGRCIAKGMRGIIDNIMTLYDMQAKAQGILIANTQKALDESDKDRKANEQSERIENFVKDLTADLNNMLTKLYWLKERKNRKQEQMTDSQMKAVTEFTTFVKTLTEKVCSLLTRFEKNQTFEEKIDKGMKELETQVKVRLKEYDEALSETLKDRLSKYISNKVESIKKFFRGKRVGLEKAKKAKIDSLPPHRLEGAPTDSIDSRDIQLENVIDVLNINTGGSSFKKSERQIHLEV